jgi:hypothetical protein
MLSSLTKFLINNFSNAANRLRFIFRAVGGENPELLYFLEQPRHFPLHFVDPVHETEGDFHAREVEAHLLGEGADALEPFDIGGGIEALTAYGARGGEEAGALVITEGLGMEADHSSGHADDVAGLQAGVKIRVRNVVFYIFDHGLPLH